MNAFVKFLKRVLTPDQDKASGFVKECFDSDHAEHLMGFLLIEFKRYKTVSDPKSGELRDSSLKEPKMVTACLATVTALCPKKQIAIEMLIGMYDLLEEVEDSRKEYKKCKDSVKRPPENRSVH